ncbi:hypothetical protein FRX31_014078 [Thalictrum thalictroides]|uniref:Uncharacterized protein n=1 Tax=Thalictrum thalictroides TaxID=46969 RepID=A0A7J6WFW8_THATH|nr:hypothetical protein FRX31_014078 [Thalictrum thalictroides]
MADLQQYNLQITHIAIFRSRRSGNNTTTMLVYLQQILEEKAKYLQQKQRLKEKKMSYAIVTCANEASDGS